MFKNFFAFLFCFIPIFIGFIFFIAIYGIVLLQEGTRIVPLISSKQLNQTQRSSSTLSEIDKNYIPLRFNQAGVMPIILTTAVLVIPNYISNMGLLPFLTLPAFLQSSKILYWISYFTLILLFSSFYSTIVLNPKDISQELQKMAVSIPGVRPGLATTFYLKQVMKRVTLFGAIILAILATLPNIIEGILNVSSFNGLGTTSLLILVGVVLDISREMNAFLDVLKKYNVAVLRPKNIVGLNQVFARDLGFVIGNTLIISNVINNRSEEIPAIENIINLIPSQKVLKLSKELTIEGGDVSVCKNHVFIGYSNSADIEKYKVARIVQEK